MKSLKLLLIFLIFLIFLNGCSDFKSSEIENVKAVEVKNLPEKESFKQPVENSRSVSKPESVNPPPSKPEMVQITKNITEEIQEPTGELRIINSDKDIQSEDTVDISELPKADVQDKTSDLLKALEESKKAIDDYQEKTTKLDECARLCAGADYEIPYVRDQWKLACWQIYYYSGMESLDEQISTCSASSND